MQNMSILDITKGLGELYFVDQADGKVYDVYVSGNDLFIKESESYSDYAVDNYVFEDNFDGKKFFMYVSNGELIIKQIEG